jgi:hypothetical protein
VSPIGGAVVSAILGISGGASAYSPAPQLVQIESVRDAAHKPQAATNATDAGTLRGRVVDPYQAVIEGAIVTLIDSTNGEPRIVNTSDDGSFKFEGLRDGQYEIKIEAGGFATQIIQGVNVASRQSTPNKPLDRTMVVAPIIEEMTVSLSVGGQMELTGGVVAYSPMPLRELYVESELVIVGRVGKSRKAGREGEATIMSTEIDISRTLKGEVKKSTIKVYHYVYDEAETHKFVAGDELLLFLESRKDSDSGKLKSGYEVSDLSYGLKKLPPSELAIYEQRIKELAEIMKQPTRAGITAWLVRCAESPATRWEGAVELGRSARSVGYRKDEASNDESSQELGEATVPSASEQAIEPTEEDHSDELFVLSLTEEQKERLAQVLYSTAVVGEAEMELIDLQKELGDKRLLPFVVDQLHAAEIDPSQVVERMIEIVDELMDDEDVTELAEAYYDKVSYEDLEEAEEDSERTAEEIRERAEAAEEAKTNRKALLRAFLTVVDEKMKQPATAKDEPENPHSTH